MRKQLRFTFSVKLILLLICVIFMPMAILSSFFSFHLYQTALANDNAASQSSLESITNSLKVYFNGFTHITDSMFVSDELQDLLLIPPQTPYEKLLADRKYQKIIADITVNNYDIENVYLIGADGTTFYSNGNRYLTNIRSMCSKINPEEDRNFPYISGFYSDNPMTGNPPAYLTVIMQPLFAFDTHEYIGTITLQFHPYILSKLLDYNTDITMLTDSSAQIIYDSEGKHLNESLYTLFPSGLEGTVEYNGKKLLPAHAKLKNGYSLIQLKSYDTSSASFYKETAPVLWMFLLCTLFFTCIAILFAQKLIRPIKLLQNAMTTISSDGISSYVDIKTHDEFEALGNSYNHMLDQLRLFIKKSYNQEILHLNAEFRALQSQINPHFLYNTLESINSTAQIKHQPEISRMICCLADMFRYTTQQTEHFVPLRCELQHVKNYYQLQSINCDSQIALIYLVPDRLLDYPVPKVILQPIIENCFNYAFTDTSKQKQITLSVSETETALKIEVIDNGIGLEKDNLLKIQKRLESSTTHPNSSTSIGLYNIQQRLKISCPPGSGLQISGSPKKGTHVLLTIAKEKNNVQNINR